MSSLGTENPHTNLVNFVSNVWLFDPRIIFTRLNLVKCRNIEAVSLLLCTDNSINACVIVNSATTTQLHYRPGILETFKLLIELLYQVSLRAIACYEESAFWRSLPVSPTSYMELI